MVSMLLILQYLRTVESELDSFPIKGRAKKVYLAANFHNNEKIIENFRIQLLEFCSLIGANNIFVSIYENGSKDRSQEELKLLKLSLDDVKVHLYFFIRFYCMLIVRSGTISEWTKEGKPSVIESST
jgi:hypothetical protein